MQGFRLESLRSFPLAYLWLSGLARCVRTTRRAVRILTLDSWSLPCGTSEPGLRTCIPPKIRGTLMLCPDTPVESYDLHAGQITQSHAWGPGVPWALQQVARLPAHPAVSPHSWCVSSWVPSQLSQRCLPAASSGFCRAETHREAGRWRRNPACVGRAWNLPEKCKSPLVSACHTVFSRIEEARLC